MQRGSFLNLHPLKGCKNIEVFQVVEYVIWNHEVVSSSLAFYTWSVSLSGSGCQAFYLKIPVRIRYRLQALET
jgi:hypothetical protein